MTTLKHALSSCLWRCEEVAGDVEYFLLLRPGGGGERGLFFFSSRALSLLSLLSLDELSRRRRGGGKDSKISPLAKRNPGGRIGSGRGRE